MRITFVNHSDDQQINQYKKSYRTLARIVSDRFGLGENLSISVVLMQDEEMKGYNKLYRDKDQPTDVISFAYHDQPDVYQASAQVKTYLGDLLINTDAINRQSVAYGHSYQREALFLFVHGLLHLLGYDHQSKEAEQEMFTLQEEILSELVQ
jgi:probable rRNA maturation factor